MHIHKKSVLFFIIAVLVSGTFTVAPQKVHAQFGVLVIDDLSRWLKQALDAAGWNVAKTILGQMEGSILQWAASGFDGNPVFVQNPELYLRNLGDFTANNFISMVGPAVYPSAQAPVQQALSQKYNQSIREVLTCPETDNEAFLDGDFSAGGLDKLFLISQNPQCTAPGAYEIAREMQINEVANRQAEEIALLDQGQGFLPLRDAEGNIETPGSIINKQVNDILGSPTRQLENADSFEELIASFVINLSQRVLSEGISDLGI
ncbi:MAG: hypothetical protein AAB587_00395 [Patescibacteria group bacterium]